MRIEQKAFICKGLRYILRSPEERDAEALSKLRVQIDGETENLDREPGEAFIDRTGFEQLIREDNETWHHLFLVAEVEGQLVGFSRCEGSRLKRLAHKVEFGVCVLEDFWGYGIGKNLLKESIQWADTHGVKRIVLFVLETNEKAVQLYKKLGFDVEGVLKKDKYLSDGKYYNTIVMGRVRESIEPKA